MPRKSASKCSVIDCSNLTYDTYCTTHSKSARQQSDRDYKRERTDKREQRFYSSSDWIRTRNHKKQLNPLCEICFVNNKLKPVDIIHHIIEIKEDWSLRLSLSNLQSVCFACHNKIHKS